MCIVVAYIAFSPQILGFPDLLVEDSHKIFLLITATYVERRANATLTATSFVTTL